MRSCSGSAEICTNNDTCLGFKHDSMLSLADDYLQIAFYARLKAAGRFWDLETRYNQTNNYNYFFFLSRPVRIKKSRILLANCS